MWATDKIIEDTRVAEAKVKYDFLPNIIPNITVAHATKIIDSYASLQGAWPAIYHLAARPNVFNINKKYIEYSINLIRIL